MPWKVFEEDGSYCVHKLNDDGSMGETVACHDAQEEADAQVAALYANAGPEAKARLVFVKAVGDWMLDVLGVPYFGPKDGRDAHGEFFDEKSKLHLDLFPSPLVAFYHGYDPDGNPQGDPETIGAVQSLRKESDGVWYRVLLDKASEFAKRVWEAAQQGLAKASSGSIQHMVRVDEKTGHIENWPVVEISLFDAVGDRQPANAYAVALPAAKAAYKAAGLTFPDLDPNETPEAALGEQRGRGGNPRNTKNPREDSDVDEKQMAEIAAKAAGEAVAKAEADRLEREKKAAEEAVAEKARTETAIKAAREQWEKEIAPATRLQGGAPYVTQFAETEPFDNLDAGDMAVLVGVLNAAKAKGQSQGPSFAAIKTLALRLEEDKTRVGEMGRRAMKAVGLKANELDHSTQAGFGDEWIGVGYSQSIWDAIRTDTFVADKLPSLEVPRGVESMVLPLEGADPTFYKVAEATDEGADGWPAKTVTSSKLATANKALSLSKMGARVLWTGEMEERSVVPFVGQLRRQLQTAGAEQLEHAIIDGDTAAGATVNINHIGGTPGATDLFLLFNGFRKSPLVTTVANSRSAGGSLVVGDYLATVQLMGSAGINALAQDKVAFIIDPNVLWKSLQLTEVKTKDVFSQPTIENGRLTGIFGYPVYTTQFMHFKSVDRKANTAGKVDQTTPANNTTGAIVAVRWDQWTLGYQRRMSIETTRIARADVTEIVALMVVGLAQRDTEASAETYNVGV